MLENFFRKIVNEVLRKESREEGFQILMIGSQNRGEWEKYLKDIVDNYNIGVDKEDGGSNFNVVCMALDFAKYKLVNANLMTQNPEDSFGDIGWMMGQEPENDD